MWGMFSTVVDNMMHVGDVQYCGGNHDARGGCSVPWGKS